MIILFKKAIFIVIPHSSFQPGSTLYQVCSRANLQNLVYLTTLSRSEIATNIPAKFSSCNTNNEDSSKRISSSIHQQGDTLSHTGTFSTVPCNRKNLYDIKTMSSLPLQSSQQFQLPLELPKIITSVLSVVCQAENLSTDYSAVTPYILVTFMSEPLIPFRNCSEYAAI